MRKLIAAFIILASAGWAHSGMGSLQIGGPRLKVTTVDQTVSTYPLVLQFSNGTVSVSGATATITSGGGAAAAGGAGFTSYIDGANGVGMSTINWLSRGLNVVIAGSSETVDLNPNTTYFIHNSSAPQKGYFTFNLSSASIQDFYGSTAVWNPNGNNVVISSMGLGSSVVWPRTFLDVGGCCGNQADPIVIFDGWATFRNVLAILSHAGADARSQITFGDETTPNQVGIGLHGAGTSNLSQRRFYINRWDGTAPWNFDGNPGASSVQKNSDQQIFAINIDNGYVAIGTMTPATRPEPHYMLHVEMGGYFGSSITLGGSIYVSSGNVYTSTVVATGDMVSTNTVRMGTGTVTGLFSVSTTVFNSQPYYWPGTVTPSNCLQVGADGKTLSWATCGGVGTTNAQVYLDTGTLAGWFWGYTSTADAHFNVFTVDTTTIKNFAAAYMSTADVRMAGFSTQNSTTDARLNAIAQSTTDIQAFYAGYTSTADARMNGFNAQNSTTDVIIAALVGDTNSISADIVNLTYYLRSETTGTNSAYQLLLSSPSNLAEITKTQNVTLAGGLIKISSHVTRDIEPQVRKIPAGLWTSVTWASVGTLGGATQLVVSIATASYDLTTINEILSATSPAITATSPERFDLVSVQANDITISTSDRILVQYSARTTLGLGTNVSIYLAGNSHPSHLNTPVGGVYKFVQLADTPQTLVGSQGKYLSVNQDQTTTVFVTSITDSFNAYTATADAKTNAISISTTNLHSFDDTPILGYNGGSSIGTMTVITAGTNITLSMVGTTMTITAAAGGAGSGDSFGASRASQSVDMSSYNIVSVSTIMATGNVVTTNTIQAGVLVAYAPLGNVSTTLLNVSSGSTNLLSVNQATTTVGTMRLYMPRLNSFIGIGEIPADALGSTPPARTFYSSSSINNFTIREIYDTEKHVILQPQDNIPGTFPSGGEKIELRNILPPSGVPGTSGTSWPMLNVFFATMSMEGHGAAFTNLRGYTFGLDQYGNSVTNTAGFFSDIQNSPTSNGNLTNGFGFKSNIQNNVGSIGTYQNSYGFYSDIVQGAGTKMPTSYGFYVNTSQGSNAWGVYVAAANPVHNYFAGGVGIATDTPVRLLEVYGSSIASIGAGAGLYITSTTNLNVNMPFLSISFGSTTIHGGIDLDSATIVSTLTVRGPIVSQGQFVLNGGTFTSAIVFPDGSVQKTAASAPGAGSADSLGTHIATQVATFPYGTVVTSETVNLITGTTMFNGTVWVSSYPYVDFPIRCTALRGVVSSTETAGDPSGLSIASTTVSATNISFDFFPFPNASTHSAYFQAQLPDGYDGSTIAFHLDWFASSGTAGTSNVLFALQAVAIDSGTSLLTAYGSSVAVITTYVAGNQIARTPTSAAITIGGNPTKKASIYFKLLRLGGDGRDTLAAFANVTALDIRYRRRINSDEEHTP